VGSSAYRDARGKAAFADSENSVRFEVQVEGVRELHGARLRVFVGGTHVGSIVVDDDGQATLRLDGEDATRILPASLAGKSVRVRTERGVVVVSGQFP
jgi:hypothetical protein